MYIFIKVCSIVIYSLSEEDEQTAYCINPIYSQDVNRAGGKMSKSYLWSKEFQSGMRKVGPGSKFWYRSKFDPLTQEEYEMICELEDRKFQSES